MMLRNRIICLSVILLLLVSTMNACGPGPVEPEENVLLDLPDDAAFLFVSNSGTGSQRREVFAINAEGGNLTRITNGSYHHHVIGASRDRRYIVATRSMVDVNEDGQIDDEDSQKKSVWLLDLHEKTETMLTDEANTAEGKSISPDGEWVVFWMQLEGDLQSDIYKIRLDGTGLVNLTNTLGDYQNEYDPAWSNDGSQIAFNRFYIETARVTLNVMSADGSGQRLVYDSEEGVDTALFPKGAYDPVWSPDDEWLIFSKAVRFTGQGENLYAGVWNIFKIRSDGSGVPMNLSEGGGHSDRAEYLPSFSPEGGTIVFSSRYHDQADLGDAHLDIFVMDADSGEIISRLTDTGFSTHDMFAVWLW